MEIRVEAPRELGFKQQSVLVTRDGVAHIISILMLVFSLALRKVVFYRSNFFGESIRSSTE